MDSNKGKFLFGKIKDFSKIKGWFFGHFADNNLLKSNLVEVAWQNISNKKVSPDDKHHHKVSVEINIVITGKVKLKINNEQIEAKKGDFWIVYPYAIVTDVEAENNTELIIIKAPSLQNDKF